MKKTKKIDEKNSLGELLLRWKLSYEENKTKSLQVALALVLVLVVVLLFRSGAFKGADKNDFADATYYAATQASFVGASAPDADAFAAAASAYKNTASGAVLHADAAEAFVRRGLSDVVRKQRYSAGTKLEEGEKLNDPKTSYNAAIDEFEQAASFDDPEIKARAYYGEGVAQESLASVAENDENVVSALELAKENYEKVAAVSPDSPYATLAGERLTSLNGSRAVEYYKAIASAFVNLPDPKDAPSITSGDDSLEVGTPVNVDEEFQLNDTETPSSAADETTSADESSDEGSQVEETNPVDEGSGESPADENSESPAE